MRTELLQYLSRDQRVQLGLPRILAAVVSTTHQPQAALFSFCTAPVIDQLVPSCRDQPGSLDGRHGLLTNRDHSGQERLAREVFGQRRATGAGHEISVYLGKRLLEEFEERHSGLR